MSNYALRLPDSLAGYAKKLAQEDNVSLNQFIVIALAEKVSSLKTEAFFQERGKRADPLHALAILDGVKKTAPITGDEIPTSEN